MKRAIRTKILKWPLGTKAGFCISNDAEYLTLSGWASISSTFQNITGLRNALSTSIFIVNPNKKDPAMSLVNLNGTQNSDTGKILMQIRTGQIDGVHALGNFDNDEFEPFVIECGLKLIKDVNAELVWWSNHGGKNNRQNIGAEDLIMYQQGDIETSKYFSKKYADQVGTRFFWLDDSNISFKEIQKMQILNDRRLRNGEVITTFSRFRGLIGKPAPTLDSLNIQVSDGLLEHVIASKAGLVLYQHLGISKRIGLEIESIVENSDDIPELAIMAFERIGTLAKQGLWVANTSTFLDYLQARKHLVIEARAGVVTMKSGGRKIYLRGISILISAKPHIVENLENDDIIIFTGWSIEKYKFGKFILTFS